MIRRHEWLAAAVAGPALLLLAAIVLATAPDAPSVPVMRSDSESIDLPMFTSLAADDAAAKETRNG